MELFGLGAVVLAVKSIAHSMSLFKRAFDLELPLEAESEALEADLAAFPESHVVLAAPRDSESQLAAHNERFGEGPCAILIKVKDLAGAAQSFPVGSPQPWFGEQVVWLDPERLQGQRLGFIG